MSEHLHAEHVDGCFRCELSRDEESQYEQYTPTTDEVREDFAFPWEGFKQDREGRLAAFDRWHAAEIRRAKTEALRKAEVEIGLMGVEPWNRLTPAIRVLQRRQQDHKGAA